MDSRSWYRVREERGVYKISFRQVSECVSFVLQIQDRDTPVVDETMVRSVRCRNKFDSSQEKGIDTQGVLCFTLRTVQWELNDTPEGISPEWDGPWGTQCRPTENKESYCGVGRCTQVTRLQRMRWSVIQKFR